jgi:Na+/H+ antiporter NhaD/arsenite permease-like protein
MGFALLSRHFEKSLAMLLLPKYLPHDWKGGFILLAAVWLLSSFLDNIAAALVGGAMAHQLFRGKVVGFAVLIMSLGWHPLPKGSLRGRGLRGQLHLRLPETVHGC